MVVVEGEEDCHIGGVCLVCGEDTMLNVCCWLSFLSFRMSFCS